MTDNKNTPTPNDDDDRTLDAKAKELWRWLKARKIHIIPVVLWVDAAITVKIEHATATLIIIILYYGFFMLPGFYRAWRKKYPMPEDEK